MTNPISRRGSTGHPPEPAAPCFNGSLIIAAAIGLITQSWVIFSLVLIGMLAVNAVRHVCTAAGG